MSALQQMLIAGKGVKALGGAVSYAGGYTIHTFTTGGTFAALEDLTVDWLLVGAGGGSGAGTGKKGGGAGGAVAQGSAEALTAGGYAITIGTGSTGAAGESSTFNGNTANGGSTGGSTSGGSISGSFSGGTNGTVSGGGGAGAGGAGASPGSSTTGGAGGVGVTSSISGTSTSYGAGGGGSGSVTGGAGGNAQAGVGSSNGAGVTNAGGIGNGGGGSSLSQTTSGSNGIFIVRYLPNQLSLAAQVLGILNKYGSLAHWYDFTDMSSMYQDAAGTVPVTATSQPIGMVIDKQDGTVRYGAELVTNGTFDTDTSGWSIMIGSTLTWISGGKMQMLSSGVSNMMATVAVSTVVGKTYIIAYTTDLSNAIGVYAGSAAGGTDVLLESPRTGVAGAQRTVVFTAVSTTTYLSLAGGGANSTNTIDNFSCREVLGSRATQSTSTKRPVSSSIGVQFDGVDDALVTSAIDYTSTNKMTVIAGVRKLSDAAAGVVCEFTNSSATSGSFALLAPSSAASADITAQTNLGTLSTGTVTSNAAPMSYVHTLIADGSQSGTSKLKHQKNGVQIGVGSVDPGAGNFVSSVLNIGGRNNAASAPLNGHIAHLFVIGAALTSEEVAIITEFVNVDMGRIY